MTDTVQQLAATLTEPQKLTQKWVRDHVRALGLTFNRDSAGDYVIRHKNSPKGHGYFTQDLRDALDTARAMAKEAAR